MAIELGQGPLKYRLERLYGLLSALLPVLRVIGQFLVRMLSLLCQLSGDSHLVIDSERKRVTRRLQTCPARNEPRTVLGNEVCVQLHLVEDGAVAS